LFAVIRWMSPGIAHMERIGNRSSGTLRRARGLPVAFFVFQFACCYALAGEPGRPASRGTSGGLVGRTFYCDAARGSDKAAGTSWARAWRTLRYAVSQVRPGDTVYLRGVFNEPLKPVRSGRALAPIRFVGPAVVDTRGEAVAVELRGVSWYRVEDVVFRTMSRDLPEPIKRRPLQVALLVKGAYNNVFERCVFINAGLGTGKSVVALIWWADRNVFRDCVAISESEGNESFGRRAWLVSGSCYNILEHCSNYGPSSPGPGGDKMNGIGVGVTIYGGRDNQGNPKPCIGNRVIGHRSYGTYGYAFGITAGFSWCVDNKFVDCVGYVGPDAYAGAYANAFLTRRGCRPRLCARNGWERCVVIGGKRGYWVNGMPGVFADSCWAISVNGTDADAFQVTTQPARTSRYGSFVVRNPVVAGYSRVSRGLGEGGLLRKNDGAREQESNKCTR